MSESLVLFIPEERSSWRPPPGSGIVGSLAAARLVVDYKSEGGRYAGYSPAPGSTERKPRPLANARAATATASS